jgi:hypothetical protein
MSGEDIIDAEWDEVPEDRPARRSRHYRRHGLLPHLFALMDGRPNAAASTPRKIKGAHP